MKINLNFFQRFLLLILLFVAAGCKKEHPKNVILPEFEEVTDETHLSFPDKNFDHTLIQSNLRNLTSLTEIPDELQLGGGETITPEGVTLAASSVFRMKHPSTLDRSEVVIDILFSPLVSYKNLQTQKEVSLSEIKAKSIPFTATMQEVTTFTGKSLMSIAGTVFGFKVTNNGVDLELYKLTSGTSSSSIDHSELTTTAHVPLEIFFGDVKENYWRKFNLRFTITKDANLNHLKVENLQTGAVISCQGKSKIQSNGCQWGYGFIRCEKPNIIKVQQFIYRSLDHLSPKVLFLGHSFIEGNSLGNTPEGFDARYAAIIRATLHGNAIIAGMGGANTSNLLSRLRMDLEPFSPKYVVIDCIANENSSVVWHTNMLALIKKIRDKNAIPILVTGSPRIGYETVITAANNLIRNSLGYQYVDLNDLVSENKSSTVWKPNYGMADGVHPTVMAHREIALQFQKDIPELFTD
jgi:lysophospholipase L1-like esterase